MSVTTSCLLPPNIPHPATWVLSPRSVLFLQASEWGSATHTRKEQGNILLLCNQAMSTQVEEREVVTYPTTEGANWPYIRTIPSVGLRRAITGYNQLSALLCVSDRRVLRRLL